MVARAASTNIHELSMRRQEETKELNQVLKADDSLFVRFNKMNVQSAFEVESNASSNLQPQNPCFREYASNALIKFRESNHKRI